MKNNQQKATNEETTKIAAREAAKVAIELWEQQGNQERKKKDQTRVDRRLRNTKLLLEHYRSFVAHVENAVYDLTNTDESAIYILDMMDAYDDMDNMTIESIKNSTMRTAIIVSHITEMLKIYKAMCESSRKSEELRRFRVINSLYIDVNQMSILDLAESEFVDQRTIYRDRDIAFERLAAMFFGIDGLQKNY